MRVLYECACVDIFFWFALLTGYSTHLENTDTTSDDVIPGPVVV